MEKIFLEVLNLSITASWLVLAVLVMRLILRKSPKWINCLLWLVVGIRLVCPFSIESALSLIPSAETVPTTIVTAQTPEINSGIEAIDRVVNPVLVQNFTPDPVASVNPLQVVTFVASILWVIGIIAMVAYMIISYIKLKSKLRTAVLLQDKIYQSEFIKSPFVMGIIKPKIYIPYNITTESVDKIILHEQAHLKRHDNIIKPVAFLILSVYWFNPVMWIAYTFLCKDIELACDEKVVKTMEKEDKQTYAKIILENSTKDFSVVACPFSFGGGSIKSRIKNIMHHKKPAVWLIICSLVLCVATSVSFLTNPIIPNETDDVDISQINDKYLTFSKMFFAASPGFLTKPYEAASSDSIEFDIDNDGVIETCYLLIDGGTSGVVSRGFLIKSGDKVEFLGCCSDGLVCAGELSFIKDIEDNILICGKYKNKIYYWNFTYDEANNIVDLSLEYFFKNEIYGSNGKSVLGKVKHNDDLSSDYIFYNYYGDIIMEEKNVTRPAKIEKVGENILKYWVSTGTGEGSRFTKYCNVTTGVVTEGVFGVMYERIQDDPIKPIQQIVTAAPYDDGYYYLELRDMFTNEIISTTKLNNSTSATPDFIIECKEVTGKGIVDITYYGGEDGREKIHEFLTFE